MVITVIIAFIIAWFPYAIVSLITIFGRDDLITAEAGVIPVIFAKSSICYNPIIYALMNAQVQ
nr:ciliary opsin [Milnesium sp.]QYF06564.1 ciliary opsin [Milnesium sp.]QYF06570.1 ciliary opsin [Milnesium sp.]QYF06577.1 ciliary opsin [Milnesium sp.]